MKLIFFCPRWGSDHIPLETFLEMVRTAGFDGIECGLPESDADIKTLLETLNRSGLKYVFQHYETRSGDFREHMTEYTRHLERMAASRPYMINSHTGRDFFTHAQNLMLLQKARKISEDHKIEIAHETHRSRFSYAAHATAQYMSHPWLRLTLDISHWFCVAETLLEDQEHTVTAAIPHIQHLHARIGHTQGPQVADPHNSMWADTVERHFSIWERILTHHAAAGKKEFGITTEYGPWPYMQEKNDFPRQFSLNVSMLQQLKDRFNVFL